MFCNFQSCGTSEYFSMIPWFVYDKCLDGVRLPDTIEWLFSLQELPILLFRQWEIRKKGENTIYPSFYFAFVTVRIPVPN